MFIYPFQSFDDVIGLPAIFCDGAGAWKRVLDEALDKYGSVTLLALGKTRFDVLYYLMRRDDLAFKVVVRDLKNKGLGVKVKIRRVSTLGKVKRGLK